ncbi:MAG: hypothetical protein M1817_001880 [Caeruleum heppii]|nr:MAG: hypothetical protein M1817_001880 [Caeruleum heppii]
MVEQASLSPPCSHAGDLHYGLHHLVKHNAQIEYPDGSQRTHQTADFAFPVRCQNSYGTPTSMMRETTPGPQDEVPLKYAEDDHRWATLYPTDRLGIESCAQDLPAEKAELGLYYEGHTGSVDPYGVPYRDCYGTPPALVPEHYHTTSRPGDPPSPSASDHSTHDLRRPRPTRRADEASEALKMFKSAQTPKARVNRPPRMRKAAKATKPDKPKVPKLDAPLSELTAEYTHVPIRDMEGWVTRSSEVRQREVAKRDGYVTRPMNSFMLYRSAYAERTKLWCLQNNHQVVSSVSGESWPLESDAIRDQYTLYAKIERENHQNAHPGYKFSPSKGPASRKRKTDHSDEGPDEGEDSELSDVDFAGGWSGAAKKRNHSKCSKRQGRHSSNSPARAGRVESLYGAQRSGGGPNKSSYQATNPGKPLPAAMGLHELQGQYYQTTIHPNSSFPNVEDIRLRATEMPSMHVGYQPDHHQALTGLPGGSHYDLYQHLSHRSTPAPIEDHQVDPALFAYPGSSANAEVPRQYTDMGSVTGHQDFARYVPEQPYLTSHPLLESDVAHEELRGYHGVASDADPEQLPAFHPNMRPIYDEMPWGVQDLGVEFDKFYDE